jgi:putative ATP-dependent endonuclease of OLD family
MRLKKLKLENFRGYAKETVVDFTDELTAFLGRNDAGKSTILEALEIFFNNETVMGQKCDS